MVHLLFWEEVVDVVQGHYQHLILICRMLGHLLEDPLEGDAAGWRGMLEDLLVKLVEDRISGGVHLTVDMHRDDPRGMGLDLLEELEDGRCLSRSRRAETEGIYRPPPLQSWPDAKFEAVQLPFSMEKLIGQVI